MSDQRGTPVWFGPTERRLFGWLHAPVDRRASGAVVLCPPLVREQASAHASYRALAEQLAEAGLVAVRFDYDGTGDSAGGDGDPDRVESWLASVAHAVSLARSTGTERVGLMGMRMGALLAASAAGRLGGVEALVLWDPCWSGRTFVREQRAISLLRFGAEGPAGDPGELPGFRFDRPTIEAVSGLRLPTAGVQAVGHALVLSRPGFAVPAQVRGDLADTPVAWESAPEETGLLNAEPVRQRSVDRVAQWLGQVLAGPRGPISTASDGSDQAIVAVGQHHVVERCRTLGPLGLMGMETAPVGDADGPIMVMPNAGADWHAGNNRLWVHLARQLATRGIRSVRFDVSGLGDSPARPGQAVGLVYAPEALEDVVDVAAAVSPEDPSNVVLVGLCSSGYLSLEGALALSARGLCAINPILRFTPPEMASGPIDKRRRICQPAPAVVRAYWRIPDSIRQKVRAVAWWMVNLAQRVSRRAHGEPGTDEEVSLLEQARRTQSARSTIAESLPLRSLRKRLGALVRRGGDLVAGPSSPSQWLAELVAAGVDMFCLGGEDELRPLVEGHGRIRASWPAPGRCRLEVVPGLDHSLLFSPQRDELVTVLVEHLVDTYAPSDPIRPTPVLSGVGGPQ